MYGQRNFGSGMGSMGGGGGYGDTRGYQGGGGGNFGGRPLPPPTFNEGPSNNRGGDRGGGYPRPERQEPAAASTQELDFKSLNANKADLGVPRALHWNPRGDRIAFASESSLRIYNPSSATSTVSSSAQDPAEKIYQPPPGLKYIDMCWDRQRPNVLFAVLHSSSSSNTPACLSQIDTRTHKSIDTKLKASRAISVSAHPDGHVLALHLQNIDSYDVVQIYDIRGKPTLLQELTTRRIIRQVKWTSDGRSLMYASGDLLEFVPYPDLPSDLSTAPLSSLRCHLGVSLVTADSKGRVIGTTGQNDGMICFWDAKYLASTSSMYHRNFPAVSLAISPDAKFAAYCVDDTSLTKANPTKEEIQAFGDIGSWWNDHLGVCASRSLPGPFIDIVNIETGSLLKQVQLAHRPAPGGGAMHHVKASVADQMEFDPTGKFLAFTLHCPASKPVQAFGRAERDVGLLDLTALFAGA